MTIRQQFLRMVYPAWMWFTRITGSKRTIRANTEPVLPASPVYQLRLQLNNGQEVSMEQYRGRKLLLVNTASDCGYTGQYSELQELYRKFDGKLVVIGFPANDFKEQEKGTDEEIAVFCQVNFGVNFPLAGKSSVVKGKGQHPVFQWLSNKSLNGWNDQAPTWNFSKYIIDEEGRLTHYFDPSISPLDPKVLKAIGV